MQYIRSTLNTLRDTYAPVSHTSTFRQTGQITPEEFVLAGDFLVYKFPSWSWSDASSPTKRVSYLPAGKQFLVTRGVPCHRRLDDGFAGKDAEEGTLVRDFLKETAEGGTTGDDEDDGWLRTGSMAESQVQRARDVRTADEQGRMEDRDKDEEEEIPDMEDDEDDDEAIIKDKQGKESGAPPRTYNLYIMYTPYYRTPRLYLSGYQNSAPLAPQLMMEDIVGDYTDKTVTLEPFPFIDAGVKMASVHPCRHASVMKVLLVRADAALKLRLAKLRQGQDVGKAEAGMEGLVDDAQKLKISEGKRVEGKEGKEGEWEVLDEGEGGVPEEDEVAIRVDQYLVVFLKFMASVTPGIEHDFTMGV